MSGTPTDSASQAREDPSNLGAPNSGDSDPLPTGDPFVRRHIGPGGTEIAEMLERCRFSTLEALSNAAVPDSIQSSEALDLPGPRTEFEALRDLRAIARRNVSCRSFIGMGYYDCIVPPVIQRNILENPGWYTQYTPYQAEIAQGRLEGLLTFQTMVCDLTGLDVANASLLDEGTAAAEAMALCFGASERKHRGEDRNVFFVATNCHSQTVEIVTTRANAVGIDVVTGGVEEFESALGPESGQTRVFGLLVQYPGSDGVIDDHEAMFEKAHDKGVMTVAATDLLALTLLRPPGDFGADVAVGNSQRFGVPLGFGGPHAAFFATRDEFKRQLPGRIVGVSKDAAGRPAYRLSLQTREQHIRRDKATSNICTAQALLANMAAMYAVYHGPEGLKTIARRVRFLANAFAIGMERMGWKAGPKRLFDTVSFAADGTTETEHPGRQSVVSIKERAGISVVYRSGGVNAVSFDETSTAEDVRLFE